METEPQIVFEQMDPSDAVRQRVLDELAELERFHGRITSARVAMSIPPREHRKGYLHRVNIHLVLPGGREVAVSDNPHSGRADDLDSAIEGAFAVARRQLQDEKRQLEGKTKTHAGGPEQIGQVIRLYPVDGFGFIVTPSGHEVWFSQRKVKRGEFDSMEIGTRVYFEEELGDQGPQATTVRIAHDAAGDADLTGSEEV